MQQAEVAFREAKMCFDLNQKRFCLPSGKMCLPNMKFLENLVVAKQASKDTLLKLSHAFWKPVLVSIARP